MSILAVLCNLLDVDAERGAYFPLTFHAGQPFQIAISLSYYHETNWKTILLAPVEEPVKEEEIVVDQKEKEVQSESKLFWKSHAGPFSIEIIDH